VTAFRNSLADSGVLQSVKAAKLKEAADRPCYPKVRYQTAAEADTALQALRAQGKDDDPAKPLNRYHCRFCRGFHLGRTPRPGAVPVEGNRGTVSFEETVVGDHPPAPQNRRRRRETLAAPLPPTRKGRRPQG